MFSWEDGCMAPQDTAGRCPCTTINCGCRLRLRGELVADAAQGEGVAGDAEAGDDTLADRGGLRGGTAPDRVRDVHLGDREFDLRQSRDEGGIAGAEGGRVEDRRVEALVVGGVEAVDDLAFDVGVEDLDLDAELGGVAADALVVFGQGPRAEDIDLDLAAHVHAGAVNHQDFRHDAVLAAGNRRADSRGAGKALTSGAPRFGAGSFSRLERFQFWRIRGGPPPDVEPSLRAAPS